MQSQRKRLVNLWNWVICCLKERRGKLVVHNSESHIRYPIALPSAQAPWPLRAPSKQTRIMASSFFFFFNLLPWATLISQGKVLATYIDCVTVRWLLQWEARRSVRGFLKYFEVSIQFLTITGRIIVLMTQICCITTVVLYHSLRTSFIYCT